MKFNVLFTDFVAAIVDFREVLAVLLLKPEFKQIFDREWAFLKGVGSVYLHLCIAYLRDLPQPFIISC